MKSRISKLTNPSTSAKPTGLLPAFQLSRRVPELKRESKVPDTSPCSKQWIASSLERDAKE